MLWLLIVSRLIFQYLTASQDSTCTDIVWWVSLLCNSPVSIWWLASFFTEYKPSLTQQERVHSTYCCFVVRGSSPRWRSSCNSKYTFNRFASALADLHKSALVNQHHILIGFSEIIKTVPKTVRFKISGRSCKTFSANVRYWSASVMRLLMRPMVVSSKVFCWYLWNSANASRKNFWHTCWAGVYIIPLN